MGFYACIAEALKYPGPESKKMLFTQAEAISEPQARAGFLDFVETMIRVELYEWEELYTRTWDLQPAVVPYVGYQIWGDSYPRGQFMSQLQGAMMELRIDTEGELPDHLIPILRYLDVVPEPIPALTENFLPALKSMRQALKKVDPENPYLRLLDVLIVQAAKEHKAKQPES